MVRSSKGRQKLEMVEITSESRRRVTFSKRQSRIFKKPSELSTLCRAEVAIIVFSPGKKAFSFGHPSVEKVAERFISGNTPQTSGAFQLIEVHRHARVGALRRKLSQVLVDKNFEGAWPTGNGEEQRSRVGQKGKAGQSQNWWENPIESLTLLEKNASLRELRHDVAREAEKILIQNLNPPQPMVTQNTSTEEVLPFDTWRYGNGNGFF